LGIFSDDNDFVGIEVASTAIKLVQLRKSNGAFNLVAFGSAQLPPNLAPSDSKLDMQKVAGILSQLVKSSRVSTKNVATALPGAAVFSTVIKMPPMNPTELAQAVKYQAEQNIPLKIEDVRIDWQVIRENPETKESAVMVVSAPNQKVNQVMELFGMADMEVVYLETSPIAVARAISNPADPLVMIVDLGASSTGLSVVENGIVSHVRSLPAGGAALTRAIAQNLGLDNAQAEQFKRKFGLSQDKLEGQVSKAMYPIISNITLEIQRSIKFYSEQYGGNVQKIVLTGGGARMPEMISYLKSLLGIEVVYGNAWTKVKYQPAVEGQLSQLAFEFAEVVGLAMREN